MEGMSKGNKIRLFLSTAILAGLFSVFMQSEKEVTAYQFTGISSNEDAGRHRQLLWVRNDDVLAHEDGDVVVWTDGSVTDGVEVTTTTTANNGLVAGVVAQTSIAADSWGFIQTHGYHAAITIGVANSAGNALVTSTTGEAAGVYSVLQATGTAAGEATSFGVFAVALEATTSSTTVKGFILR